MTDPTEEFFKELRSRGHDPVVRNVVATVRFDLIQNERTERWFLGIHNGDLSVSMVDSPRPADCVMTTRRAVFDGIATGASAMTAMLRGELTLDGEPEVWVLCRRLLPEPLHHKESTA
jgi:hypothetical protein